MAKLATVLYHRADFDGLLSGAVCFHNLQKEGFEVDLIGWDYGDPIPSVDHDRTLYMVDLCVDQLMTHPFLVWIDHHASAIRKINLPVPGYQLDGVAACRLCYQWFKRLDVMSKGHQCDLKQDKNWFLTRSVSEPTIIMLAGEYDVWDLRDNRSTLLQYGLTASFVGEDPNETAKHLAGIVYGELVEQLTVDLIRDGIPAQKWHKALAKAVLDDYGYIVEFEGKRFLTLCSSHVRGSLWFENPKKDLEFDALMSVRLSGKGTASISLYRKEGDTESDLSMIATLFGGGGHKGACGFQLSLEDAVKYHLVQ